MAIIEKALVLCGIILMAYNVTQCFNCFSLKRDVIVDMDKRRKLELIGIYASSIIMTIVFIVILFSGETNLAAGVVVFLTALFFTVATDWMINMVDAIRERTTEIAETLIGVIEAGDTNLDGHSIHVMDISMLIYDYLPYGYQKKINPENLRYAALFLDIGKLGIPGRVLNKPGKLEGTEWDMMRRHPEIGVNVLKQMESFDEISDWILYHHERMDGDGYYKIKGEEIPLAARIIAVADTYSAIVMVRSYKPSRSYDDALAALKIASGTQLDKEIVDIFCDIPREKVERCTKEVRDKMAAYLAEDFRDED